MDTQDSRLTEEQVQELIEQAKQGDSNAANLLIGAYEGSILGFIKRKINHQQDVEDTYQDTCMEVIRNLSVYDSTKGKFYTFYRKTADFMVKRYYDTKTRNAGKYTGLDENVLFEDNELLIVDFLSSMAENENSELYTICMKVLFSQGGMPHQVISFCFNKLIYPAKYESYRGYPGEIVKDLSDSILLKLFDQFRNEYAIYFRKMDFKLFRPVYVVMEEKEDGTMIGAKLLRDYYGKDPVANISDWSYRVAAKVKKIILRNYYDLMFE